MISPLKIKFVASKLDLTNATDIVFFDMLTKAYGKISYYDIKTFHICWNPFFCSVLIYIVSGIFIILGNENFMTA